MTVGRLVVVTGTSRGLGLAMATTLLDAGFTVVGIARSEAPQALTAHPDAGYHHLIADVSHVEGIQLLAQSIVERHGRPFGLVNNAAIGTDGLLPTMHNSEIESVIRTNLTAPIILCKYLSRSMLAAREGRIVNVTSIVAGTGYRGLSAYAATKAGLEGFSRSLARDLGPRGVTVNCVAPGFLETDMTAGLGGENMDRIKRRAALNRFPTAGEVASGVAYLLSEAAAGVTGTVLTIDAGNTA